MLSNRLKILLAFFLAIAVIAFILFVAVNRDDLKFEGGPEVPELTENVMSEPTPDQDVENQLPDQDLETQQTSTIPTKTSITDRLEVTLPKGGETFCVGKPTTIRWENATNLEIVYVGLYLGSVRINLGSYPGTYNDLNAAGVGEILWTPSASYKTHIGKISVYGRSDDNTLVEDKSEGLFTIEDCRG